MKFVIDNRGVRIAATLYLCVLPGSIRASLWEFSDVGTRFVCGLWCMVGWGAVVVAAPPGDVPANDGAGAMEGASKVAQGIPPDIEREMKRRRAALHEGVVAHEAAGKPMGEFHYSWSADLNEVSAGIQLERDPARRQALLFSYLDLGYGAYGAELNPRLCEQALSEITFSSPLWELEPDLVGVAARCAPSRDQSDEYIREVAAGHPSEAVRGIVSARYSPDRRVMKGKPVPAFRFTSMDDPSTMVSDSGLRGKTYLLDFWATFCVPCVEEIENYTRLHAKYKERGFEIVSLSLDEDAVAVREFRSEKWPMEWMNAMVSEGLRSEVLKIFEVSGLPRMILVDKEGMIIATNDEVRGRNLEETLKRVLEVRE